MVNLKNKFWLIILISAILGILSIGIPWQIPLHPTIPNYYGLLWLFGVLISIPPTGDPITQFLFFTFSGITGIITTIIIIVFSLLLLITSLKARKKELSVKLGVMWLIAGLALIVIDMLYFILLYPYSVLYVMQLGSLFPFIGGGLSLLTGIASLIISKRG